MAVIIDGDNTPTAGGIVYGDGTAYASTAAGSAGQVLQSNGAGAPTWVAAPATSPAGSTGQVQYNDGGAFGAISSGTSGQVLTSAGAGAAPSWATISTAPTFTATGSISAAGVAVALNSDGTVSQISGSSTSFSKGTGVALPSNRTGSYTAAAFDPVNNKVLVLIKYSSYLMGYMGTVSGTTITFGSEYQIVTSSVGKISVAYDATNNKFVTVYVLSNTVRCKALTVSGSAISAGAETTLMGGAGGYIAYNSIAYSAISNKFMVVAGDDTNDITAFSLISISGTSVVEHSYQVSVTAFIGQEIVCNPDSGVFIYGGRSVANATGYVGCITVSGTSFTRGSLTAVSACNTNISFAADFVPFIYSAGTANGYRVGVATMVSLNSLPGVIVYSGYESNAKVTLTGSASYNNNYYGSAPRILRAVANPAGSNIMVLWNDGNAGQALSLTFTISPSGAVVPGPEQIIYTPEDSSGQPSLVYCPNTSNMVAVVQDSALSSRIYNVVVVPDGYSTNALSYIGYSTSAASSGQSVNVTLPSNMEDNQSGLTQGKGYYLTYSGSLSTSSTGLPFVGRAYSATRLYLAI